MSDVAKLAVYCGSSSGRGDAYRRAAVAVGSAIATSGHELVYGGGDVGLMGAVANAVLAEGGAARGVITEQLVQLEVGHRGLTELVVVGDMHARKAEMAARCDGVIVLPGGFGTLDEVFEVLTWNQLGIHPGRRSASGDRPGGGSASGSVPVVFVDVDDYFAPLFAFVEGAVQAGFMKPEHGALVQRTSDPVDAVELASAPPPALTPKWVDVPAALE